MSLNNTKKVSEEKTKTLNSSFYNVKGTVKKCMPHKSSELLSMMSYKMSLQNGMCHFALNWR